METISTADLIRCLAGFAQRVADARDELSALDAATGDADHGANLARGTIALAAMLADAGGQRPGEVLRQAGLVMVDTIGGSSGALYGTVFLRMAAAVGPQARAIAPEMLAQALQAAAQGITDRGRARPGDKTMLDAMQPAATAYAGALSQGDSLPAALRAAADAAAQGAAATAAMRARRGKSSYVGDRSIGTVDPGAASVALLFAAMAQIGAPAP
ncbi:MAG: dihydroxyacetone kinase subunit DhaL [Rhodobacter sp. CACIA14H1]|nr:MAG: dihydroxyacetone kinase subunit DhaL [Rhodobacter sp. CACIA14H1]